jgi:hypothetical protein
MLGREAKETYFFFLVFFFFSLPLPLLLPLRSLRSDDPIQNFDPPNPFVSATNRLDVFVSTLSNIFSFVDFFFARNLTDACGGVAA